MTALVTTECRTPTVAALAFALATPVAGRACDGEDCPAEAARRVDIFDQDLYFCMHHWAEHRRRLPSPPIDAVTPPQRLFALPGAAPPQSEHSPYRTELVGKERS